MTYGNQNQSNKKIYWVKDNLLSNSFPEVSRSLREPDGLLAIGGELTESRLLEAYQKRYISVV